MLYLFLIIIILILLEIGAYLWHRYAAHLLPTPIAHSHQYHHNNIDTGAWYDFAWLALFYFFFIIIWLICSNYFNIKENIQYLVLAVVTAWIVVNAYVHSAYHRPNCYLAQLHGYERWSREHSYHHDNQEVNYGIITSLGDRLGGTYQQ